MAGLERVVKSKNCDIDVPPWSTIGDSADGILRTLREHADEAIDNVRNLGVHFDGVVFKNGMYQEWAKLKHQKTIDLIVTGIKPGKGKYAGMCGSLECAVAEGVEVANVSGMNDTDRQDIGPHDIGRVVEVEYERVGSRGRLQHPRFLWFRPDKKPEQCTADQDPALERKLCKT
jgi:ATP-dependent DNA ligase